MTNFSDISADPLYLTALASLGSSVPAKLMAAPSNNSIAVLPFLNMSDEQGQEHFTDGLTEDIITDLSNVSGFFVIARNSTFAYKGKPTDVRQVAHDLGVKYILEGSARRAGQRLRINVQLIDAAEGGNHIWAERFDRDLADVFAVQDEVARRIVEAITGKLATDSVLERYHPTSIEAYDLVQRSRGTLHLSPATNNQAYADFERAIELDPNYAEAYRRLAFAQNFKWSQWGEPQEPYRRLSLASAHKAVELDPNDSFAHGGLGYMLIHERRWDEATACFKQSLHLNANNADTLVFNCDLCNYTGKPKDGLAMVAKALRVNPHPPAWYHWVTCEAMVAARQFDKAIAILKREQVYNTVARRVLAAALALLGRDAEAKREAEAFQKMAPDWRISAFIATQPFEHQKDADFWIEAYRLAGLPE